MSTHPTAVLEQWPITDLIPLSKEHNPRTTTKTGAALLDRSFEEFGNLLPITVNRRSKRIVAGNQRYKHFKHTKVTMVDVWVVDVEEFLEPILAIALNKHAASFDGAKLSDLVLDVMRNTQDRSRLDLTLLPAATLGSLLKKFDGMIAEGNNLVNQGLTDNTPRGLAGMPAPATPNTPVQEGVTSTTSTPRDGGPSNIQVNINTGVKNTTTKDKVNQFKLMFGTPQACSSLKELLFTLKMNNPAYEGMANDQILIAELTQRNLMAE